MMHINKGVVITTACALCLLFFVLFSRSEVGSQSLNAAASKLSSTTSQPNSQKFAAGSDTQLHAKIAHAEKLWQKDVHDRQIMLNEVGYDRVFPDGYIYPYNIWDFARPSFYCPHDLERVGTLGDGGKVVCGMTRYERFTPGPATTDKAVPELIVYSFGVNDDSSFEHDLLERTNARIWGYDYSVAGWAKHITPNQTQYAFFEKMAIDKITNLEKKPPSSTVHDLMRKNGHDYVDIVKMDIEAAEFDALTEWIRATKEAGGGSLPFGQMLLEIHFMNAPPTFTVPKNMREWLKWWGALEEMGLRPANNEDNWIGDVGGGHPRFMEYTLINALDKQRNKLLWA